MTKNDDVDKIRRKLTPSFSITTSLGAVILFFVVSGAVAHLNTRTLFQDSQQIAQTHEITLTLGDVLTSLQDAETGQRGFVITGNESYLAPYNLALARIEGQISHFADLVKGRPEQEMRLPEIRAHSAAKLRELAETIDLRRKAGFEASRAVVVTDRGKNDMDLLRGIIADLRHEEHELRVQRQGEMDQAYHFALISGFVTALVGLLVTLAVAVLIRRTSTLRARQEWLQTGMVNLSQVIAGDQRIEQLTESMLRYFAGYFNATAGAFYVRNDRAYGRTATYGVPSASATPESFHEGDGLLGQAARERKVIRVDEVPEKLLTLGSALTHGSPRQVVIAPASTDGLVNSVFELGFLQALDPLALELLDRASETIAIAVKSANYRTQLQDLLEETQRQSEELQAQSEELRVSNEELEEQSRALKESQVQLEQQQAEVEQTNAELSEQTQLLENQRDELTRSKSEVQLKAQELERASQYKSNFLANMSHELRTPLNSSLILAKLLADNPKGTLTAEQVRYAQTIQSSGNDLLALINDILDLSKIEAGHMEVRAEGVAPSSIVKDVTRIFEPLTAQKQLAFKAETVEPLPALLETDVQRLQQILKNLISNAVKFTEQGSVTLTVKRAPDAHVCFAVTDTGIGIAPEHQRDVFEAFRQADGTISRKFGGTGLGLSISRELARLLGGTIELHSELGKGSTFALILPERYSPEQVQPRPLPLGVALAHAQAPLPSALAPVAPASGPPRAPSPSRTRDDRENLTLGGRIILIIEDDQSFTQILYDLAHEMGFQSLIAHTAEDALILAQQYTPSAVLLDVGLPDHSGLTVLDRLKRDARTRHIPVHVVTAGDHAQTAYSLGAAGFMIKPVKREDLQETFQQLETHLASRMRRVLIVEDDDTQREAVSKLLSSHEVETVGVGTAAECLELLKGSTFDCMVLDLSLPDATGYSLLETLSREDAHSFPPVIVYTGRDLKADEEQKLRRYSKSIIIKGAKSPERLLDEVTLFLHQVVSDLPAEQQRMLEKARGRDAILEGRTILIVEDDVRNFYALTSLLEPHGVKVQIARNGKEALSVLDKNTKGEDIGIDLVLMDVMMPEMDGLTATREIRRRREWKKLPIIMLTAKAMRDDQERCMEAGANDYMAKPLDVEKLLSLVRVWMPR